MTAMVDTSWLFALYSETDVHHRAAADEAAGGEGFQVPPFVLKEFLHIVRKRHGKDVAVNALYDLRQVPHATLIDEVDLSGTLSVWQDHAISLADANAIAWAAHRQAHLRTFDDRQRRILARL